MRNLPLLLLAILGVPSWGSAFVYFLSKAMKSKMAVSITLTIITFCLTFGHILASVEAITDRVIEDWRIILLFCSLVGSVYTWITIVHVKRKVKADEKP